VQHLRKLSLTLLLLTLWSCPPVQAKTPPAAPPQTALSGDLTIPNLGVAKLEIKQYMESGRYERDIKVVTDAAQRYLADNLARFKGLKPAAVLDIDETSLSNWEHIQQCDFGYFPGPWNNWIAEARATPIQGTLNFYHYAHDQGVAIFFITGRPEAQRAVTEKNLARAGYLGYQKLILKPVGPETIGQYKVFERKRLTEAGYHIVVNIGDQASDLEGGYSDSGFKLPNPMYFIR
jgi:acid phosphatase